MKSLIALACLVFVSACGSIDQPEPSFTLSSSTCGMPATKLEIGDTFFVLEQGGRRFYALTTEISNLVSGYKMEIRERSYGFHLAKPVWEDSYLVTPTADGIDLRSANCDLSFKAD